MVYTVKKVRVSKSSRAKMAAKRPSGYRRTKPASRMVVNRKRYNKNKVLSAHINNIAESKLLAITQQDERQPIPIQSGAQATFVAFNIGNTAVFTGSVPIGGISVNQGTGFNQRNGNYIYYKKTHLVSRIEMNVGANAPQYSLDK